MAVFHLFIFFPITYRSFERDRLVSEANRKVRYAASDAHKVRET